MKGGKNNAKLDLNPSLSAKKWLTDICRPFFVYPVPKTSKKFLAFQ